MTELERRLTEEDPLRLEGELSATDAQRMRRLVVAAAAESVPTPAIWRRPLALAALAVLLVIAGAMASHQVAERSVAPVPAEPFAATGAGSDERRQLQFSTPGGTRIIWIFDQNLRLQESMP